MFLTVETATADDAARLARALAAAQSIVVRGSLLEVRVGNEEPDRLVTQLIGEVETFLAEETLDPVTMEIDGNTLVVRAR
jgi:hypothetical protein